MGVILSFTAVRPGRLARLRAARAAGEAEWERELEAIGGGPDGYLDKSWDGLRYLLTAADAGIDLLFDADLLDDEQYFAWPADRARDTAARLAALPFAALADHYDPAALTHAGVYPGIWSRDGDEGLRYLEHHYGVLTRFFRTAARTHSAAVMHFG